jgi:phage FluMu gp28-like protein
MTNELLEAESKVTPGSAIVPGALQLRKYQLPVVSDHRSGIVVLHWSRQIGKSFALAAWAVYRLLTKRGRLVTVLSNSRENGAEFLLKCSQICRLTGTRFATVVNAPELEFEDYRMELRIESFNQLGRIKVLAANPRTARGFSGDLILDEFAFHENANAIWEAAEPILAANPDYLCRIASTGNGRHNLFYRIASQCGVRNAECVMEREFPESGFTHKTFKPSDASILLPRPLRNEGGEGRGEGEHPN